jgi:tetratricopeptide (TPR) repeat protein
VLPCSNPSPAPSDEWLCDVLAQQLISTLHDVLGIEVISFPVVHALEGDQRSPIEIGRELGVDAIVTTELRQAGGEFLIRVDVTDIRSRTLVSASDFAAPAADTRTLPQDVALSVAEALEFRLTNSDRTQLRLYDSYQTARYWWEKRSAEGLNRAIEIYTRILEEDPEFALAHAGLASSYVLLPYYTSRAPSEVYPLAREAAERAMELDETLPDAHAALGLVQRDFDRNWEGAKREFERAIQLDPQSGTALQWHAELLAMTGRFDEAETYIRRAQEARPLSLTVRAVHGYILICADRTDEARSLLEATVAMDPEHPLAHWFLGQLHFRNGDYGRAVESLRVASSLSEEASRMMADLASALALNGDRDAAQNLLANLKRRSRPEEGVSSYEYAIVYTGLGDMAQAISELEAAMEERTWQVVYMGIDPMLGPLRESDRYSDLLLQLGLPSD